MMRIDIKRTALLALLVSGGLLIGNAGPTHADCVLVSASLQYEDKPSDYVLGPNHCVLPTPWPETVHVWRDYSNDDIPNCLPNGFRVDAHIPLP